MSHNKLDDIFKAGLKDAEATPPAHVWAKIQASGVVKPVQDRGVISINTIRWVIAAVIALLMTVGGFWIFQKESASPSSLPMAAENQPSLELNEGSETIDPSEMQDILQTNPEAVLASEDSGTETSKHASQFVSTANRPKYTSDQKETKVQPTLQTFSVKDRQEEAVAEVFVPLRRLETSVPTQVESLRPIDHFPASRFNVSPNQDLAVKFSIDPNALIYAADQLVTDRTLTEKLFNKAGEKMTDFAEAAGFPVRKWSKVKEVEILY